MEQNEKFEVLITSITELLKGLSFREIKTVLSKIYSEVENRSLFK